MRQTYIILGVVSVLMLGAVIYGFTVTGSPFARQAQVLDQTRISDFNNIQYSVEDYYRQNYRLPKNLDELDQGYLKLNDPKTGEPYDFIEVTKTSYKLCTTFSTDSNDAKKNNSDPYLGLPNPTEANHKKGYDCITYDVPDYLNQPFNPPPAFLPPPTISWPQLYTNDAYNFELTTSWAREETTNFTSMKYIWRPDTGSYNTYFAVMPNGEYETDPIQATPVQNTETIGARNAVVKTWSSSGITVKRYYITESVGGWTKCNIDLTNASNCGKIEMYASDQTGLTDLESLKSTFQFK